ncbi:hypothetical protein E6D70_10875 [Escherichia coli]|nr:hypothetical protein [Escherichia coli]
MIIGMSVHMPYSRLRESELLRSISGEDAGVISPNADLTLKTRHSTSHTNTRFSRKTATNINQFS